MPKPLVDRARASLRLRTRDYADALAGRRDGLVPPRRLQFVGQGDFVATGDEFLGHLVALAGLGPDERVLDVGCGIGRIARPLAGYLTLEGSYDGFDVNRDGIAWCERRYRRLPHFRFAHADLANRRYNPAGTQDAATFRFPYEDACFDVAVLTSVLTHLIAAEALRYLAQTRRVLAPGGRMLATLFVLDERPREHAALAFGAARDGMAVVDEALPEQAVAYEEEWLLEALRDAGLDLVAIHPGAWTGAEQGTSFQDLVIARA